MWSWIRKRQVSTRELLFRIIPKVELVPVTVPEKYVIPKSFKPPEPKTLTKETAREKLHSWYKTVNRCTIREVKSARDAIKSREDNVLNYFIARSSNASAESLNSKLKGFRAQLRSVSDLPFFMYRICTIFG